MFGWKGRKKEKNRKRRRRRRGEIPEAGGGWKMTIQIKF